MRFGAIHVGFGMGGLKQVHFDRAPLAERICKHWRCGMGVFFMRIKQNAFCTLWKVRMAEEFREIVYKVCAAKRVNALKFGLER